MQSVNDVLKELLVDVGINIGKIKANRKIQLTKYKDIFKIMEMYNLNGKCFDIVGRIPPNSANGTAFIIQFKRDSPDGKKFLVKVPLSSNSDSLTYEYYIGIALNLLTLHNKPTIFSLTYGKTNCGLHNTLIPIEKPDGTYAHIQVDLSSLLLCDSNFQSKFHLITEFVDYESKIQTESFTDYINKLYDNIDDEEVNKLESNIIDILIMILTNLEVAYQHLQFTHYDLHTGNILLSHLNSNISMKLQIDGQDKNFSTSIIPTIIDYGRCYVNPRGVDNETMNIKNNTMPKETGDILSYTDEKLPGKQYNNFKSYQTALSSSWILTKDQGCDCDSINCINFCSKDKQISNWINKYRTELQKKNTTEEFARKFIINNIFNKYNTSNTRKYDDSGKIITYCFGIKSDERNKHYDLFRLCSTVIDHMIIINKLRVNKGLHTTDYNSLWIRLKKQFEIEYPFYDEAYYSLPCNYHINDIIKGPNKPLLNYVWLDKPANVAKLLYRVKNEPGFFMQNFQTGGRGEGVLKIEKPPSEDIISSMNINYVSKDKHNLLKRFSEDVQDFDIDKYFSKDNYIGILDQKGLVQKMFPQVMRDDNYIISDDTSSDVNSDLKKLLDVLNSKHMEYTEYFDTDEKIGVDNIPVSNFFNKQYLKEQIQRLEQDNNDGLAAYVLEMINENSKKTLF